MGVVFAFLIVFIVGFLILIRKETKKNKVELEEIKEQIKEIPLLKTKILELEKTIKQITQTDKIQQLLKISKEDVITKSSEIDKQQKIEEISLDKPASKEELETPQEGLEKITIVSNKSDILAKKSLSEQTKIPLEKEHPIQEIITKLEERFSENYTGILGSLALIVGITFLGIYTIIKMEPLFRFIILCIVSFMIYGFSIFLSKKDYWKKLSLWVRSTAAVVLLISCIGSVSFDALKWTDNKIIHIILITFALGINLLIGFLNQKEYFAIFHLVLNYIALFLITQQDNINLLFIIGYAMTFFGVLMCSQKRTWEKFLLISLFLLSSYHYFYYDDLNQSFHHSFLAILFIFINIASLLTHYRKVYFQKSYDDKDLRWVFYSHIIIWFLLLFNSMPYIHKTQSYILFFSILFIFNISLSIYAKKQFPFFYFIESFISFIFFLSLYISIYKHFPSIFEFLIFFPIILMSYAYIYLLFIKDIKREFREITTEKIKKAENRMLYIFIAIINIVIVLNYLYFLFELKYNNFKYEFGLQLLFFLFIFLGKLILNKQIKTKNINIPLFLEYTVGIFPVILLLCLGINIFIYELNTEYNGLLLLLIPYFLLNIFLYLKEKTKEYHYNLSYLINYIIFNILLFIFYIYSFINDLYRFESFFWILLFVSQLIFFKWNQFYFYEIIKKNTFIPITILSLISIVGSYTFTISINPQLTSALWLILSLILLEIRKIKYFQIDEITENLTFWNLSEIYLFLYGFIALVLFMIRFFFIDINSESLFLSLLYTRNILEIFSIIVFIYWMYDLYIYQKSFPIYNKIKTILLEIILILILSYFLYEFDSKYFPIGFNLLAIILYFIGIKLKMIARLISYSFLLFLASLFHIAFLSSTLVTPSDFLKDQSWLFSMFGLLFSIIYLIVRFKTQNQYFNISNENFKYFINLENNLKNRFVAWFNYPIFIGIAFFLYWSFEKTLLSLFWMVECFILFIFSIVFKERLFRITSMLGIVIIIIRMIFYDLKQSDILTKSIVFIIAGIILIAMNTIYNKYKEGAK